MQDSYVKWQIWRSEFHYGAKISYLIASLYCVIHYEWSRHYLTVTTVPVIYLSVQDNSVI